MEIASRLTNPDLNPHVCRYLERDYKKNYKFMRKTN